jgi:hypothetical protein
LRFGNEGKSHLLLCLLERFICVIPLQIIARSIAFAFNKLLFCCYLSPCF